MCLGAIADSDGCAGREPSQLKTSPIVERFFLAHAETRTVNDSWHGVLMPMFKKIVIALTFEKGYLIIYLMNN